jgi:alpha-ketoglutarate-dependent 2,4-dichlorophenoxyacetate dioxygenase
MALSIRQVHPLFVAEVTGVDMCQPPDADLTRQITDAADRYAVLIFRRQQITDEQHLAFTAPFGRLETTIKAYRAGSGVASIRMSPTSRTSTKPATFSRPTTAGA